MQRLERRIQIGHKAVFCPQPVCSCVGDHCHIVGFHVFQRQLYLCRKAGRFFRTRSCVCLRNKLEQRIAELQFFGKQLAQIIAERAGVLIAVRTACFRSVLQQVGKRLAHKLRRIFQRCKINRFAELFQCALHGIRGKVAVGDYRLRQVFPIGKNLAQIHGIDLFNGGMIRHEHCRDKIRIECLRHSEGKLCRALAQGNIQIFLHLDDIFSCFFKRRSTQVKVFQGNIKRDIQRVRLRIAKLQIRCKQLAAEQLCARDKGAEDGDCAVLIRADHAQIGKLRHFRNLAVFVDNSGQGVKGKAAVKQHIDHCLQMQLAVPKHPVVKPDIFHSAVNKDIGDRSENCLVFRIRAARGNAQHHTEVAACILHGNKCRKQRLLAVFLEKQPVFRNCRIELINEGQRFFAVLVDRFACNRIFSADTDQGIQLCNRAEGVACRAGLRLPDGIFIKVACLFACGKRQRQRAAVRIEQLVVAAFNTESIRNRRPGIYNAYGFIQRIAPDRERSLRFAGKMHLVDGIAVFQPCGKRRQLLLCRLVKHSSARKRAAAALHIQLIARLVNHAHCDMYRCRVGRFSRYGGTQRQSAVK